MKKYLLTFLLIVLVFPVVAVSFESNSGMLTIRTQRVQHYRNTTKFTEPVLNAALTVPREYFVPENKQSLTYDEHPIPIGYGQTITNMWFVCHMTNLLELQSNDKVLEIGSGSGYQASILYQITKSVYSIEIVAPLAEQAQKRWSDLGYKGIKGKAADGYFGWEENAPFDKIIVTCAADHIPVYLLRQLKNNGIMVIPVGNPFDRQTLLVIKKDAEGKISTKRLNSCKFVPFTGKMLEKFEKKN